MKKKIVNILLLLVIVILAGIGYKMFSLMHTYADSRATYTSLKEQIIVDADAAPLERKPDFSQIETSEGSCSWIYIPDTVIDYPLVQGEDNSFYLEYNAIGEPSGSGAIFVNCGDSSDMQDNKTIIYGHNMRDGSMFNCLKNYTGSDYANEHSLLYIYLDNDTTITYRILCTFLASTYDTSIYNNDDDAVSDIVSLLESDYDAVWHNAASQDGKLVFLSTCSNGDARRVVVFQEVTVE